MEVLSVPFLVHSGKRVPSGERGSTHTYPFIEENPCGPARTHKKTCEDAKAAITAGSNVSKGYNKAIVTRFLLCKHRLLWLHGL